MRKLFGAIALVAALVTGCGVGRDTEAIPDNEPTTPRALHETETPWVKVIEVDVQGRIVVCVWGSLYRGGGLSCDWDNTREKEG